MLGWRRTELQVVHAGLHGKGAKYRLYFIAKWLSPIIANPNKIDKTAI